MLADNHNGLSEFSKRKRRQSFRNRDSRMKLSFSKCEEKINWMVQSPHSFKKAKNIFTPCIFLFHKLFRDALKTYANHNIAFIFVCIFNNSCCIGMEIYFLPINRIFLKRQEDCNSKVYFWRSDIFLFPCVHRARGCV